MATYEKIFRGYTSEILGRGEVNAFFWDIFDSVNTLEELNHAIDAANEKGIVREDGWLESELLYHRGKYKMEIRVGVPGECAVIEVDVEDGKKPEEELEYRVILWDDAIEFPSISTRAAGYHEDGWRLWTEKDHIWYDYFSDPEDRTWGILRDDELIRLFSYMPERVSSFREEILKERPQLKEYL